jgi:hypothetical protein
MKHPSPTHLVLTEERRRSALARLLPLWPHEIADPTLAGQRRICRLLINALRRERQRGVAGDWTYDVGRHASLIRALRRELARLARMNAHSKTPAGCAGVEERRETRAGG